MGIHETKLAGIKRDKELQSTTYYWSSYVNIS